MGVGYIRILFVLFAAVLGHQIGSVVFGMQSEYGLYGAFAGSGIALLVIFLEKLSDRVSLRGLSAAVFGLLLALVMANLLAAAIDTMELDPAWSASVKLVIVMVLAYLGIVFAIRGRDEFNVIIPYVKFKRESIMESLIVLDTSAIIDGRIADLIQTHFLEGTFVVPRFVLKELQHVADSNDPQKRHRGKRGLEILHKLKKNSRFSFKIHNEDFHDILEVDQKIIQLARILDAKIFTTDRNLQKIAEFHGTTVLNINELSNALRPVVLPGERLEVQPIKQGKERDQVVGYLNDGTMVVVEGSREAIGRTIKVEVTSALQTSAGRMVFAKPEETL